MYSAYACCHGVEGDLFEPNGFQRAAKQRSLAAIESAIKCLHAQILLLTQGVLSWRGQSQGCRVRLVLA